MVSVTFIDHAGASRRVEAQAGESLMAAARANNVAGITADCGGYGACATCQVYIDEAWSERTGVISEDEFAMLESTNGFRPNSRLSCQILIDGTLDGLVVSLPEVQT